MGIWNNLLTNLIFVNKMQQEFEGTIIELYYGPDIDLFEAKSEFTRWLSELSVKKFLSISNTLHYEHKLPENLVKLKPVLKKLPLAKPLISIIVRFLEVSPTFTLASIGSNIVNAIYEPTDVMIDTQHNEVIEEIYKRMKHYLDKEKLEEWLNNNPPEGDPEKWILLNDIHSELEKNKDEE
jgi:hypothetical protein